MSMQGTSGAEHFHAVRFYQDSASLAGLVGDFIALGLGVGEPGVIIATPDHAQRFRTCLSAKGIDVDAALGTGMLTLLDADQTLAMFMRDDIVPEGHRFTAAVEPILTAAAGRYPGKPVRAYGEMVDVLWKQGHTRAAIKLETLWNDLARSHRFSLLCGYAMGNFYKAAATDDICDHHSHVVTDTGDRIPLT